MRSSTGGYQITQVMSSYWLCTHLSILCLQLGVTHWLDDKRPAFAIEAPVLMAQLAPVT